VPVILFAQPAACASVLANDDLIEPRDRDQRLRRGQSEIFLNDYKQIV
jgi:hypothetical protein